ncbi:acyltransferase family protein [Aliarcobacter butzleri]|uniref:acyltransferase family protein n=1 Tax=Aliarcobacter butzleri TaxID=28197 RepID=UPI001EDB4E02|nr:acyltransferase [Aliarcobacter butzleri]
MKRLDYLDFLRGIAVLLVLLSHTHHFFYNHIFNDWSGIGARGVQLFYIVSGFTIYYIYQNKLNTSLDVRNYIIKRVFRILPLYFLVLPLYFLVFGVNHNYQYPLINLITHYFLVNGFFPEYINSILRVEWSIFVEFMFYIVFGLVLYKLKNCSIKKLLVITFLISIFIAFISNTFYKNDIDMKTYFYLSPYFQFYNFFIGVFIASLNKDTKIYKSKILLLIPIICFILIGFFIKSTIIQTYMASIIFAIILLNLSSNNYKYPKVFLSIGTISFSLYIMHYFFIMYYEKYIIHNFINFFLLILSIFIVSSFTYKFIEKIGIQIGRRFIK